MEENDVEASPDTPPLTYATTGRSARGWNLFHGALVVAVLLAGSVPALIVATHYPDNHVDLDVRPLAVVPAVGVLWSVAVLVARRGSRRMAWVTGATCLIVLVGFLVADHFNFVNDYDLWAARGMPAAGE